MASDPDSIRSGGSRIYVYDPDRCPFTATWNVIGGKWKGLIWWRLSRGLGRFGELRRSIPQITKKVLVEQLRELERDGVVVRRVFAEVPHRVEYSLSDYGRSLEPVIDAICVWGARHLEERPGDPSLGQRNDGAPAHPAGSA